MWDTKLLSYKKCHKIVQTLHNFIFNYIILKSSHPYTILTSINIELKSYSFYIISL